MAQQKGSTSVLAFDHETTYNTARASNKNLRKVYFLNESIRGSQELFTDETLSGQRNAIAPESGNIDVGGSVSVNLCPTTDATLIKYALGNVATTNVSATIYNHEITVGALLPGLMFEKQFTDLGTPQYITYNGCKISKASFKFPKSGYVTADFEIKGASETISGSTYSANLISNTFNSLTSSRIVSVQEGGANVTNVVDAEVTIDNDLDTDTFVIGSGGTRQSLPEGLSMISGKITCLFDSIDMYNKAVNGTESSLRIHCSANSTPARSVEFFISELRYERSGPVINGSKGLLVELPFRAYYSNSTNANASSIVVTIQNGLSVI